MCVCAYSMFINSSVLVAVVDLANIIVLGPEHQSCIQPFFCSVSYCCVLLFVLLFVLL